MVSTVGFNMRELRLRGADARSTLTTAIEGMNMTRGSLENAALSVPANQLHQNIELHRCLHKAAHDAKQSVQRLLAARSAIASQEEEVLQAMGMMMSTVTQVKEGAKAMGMLKSGDAAEEACISALSARGLQTYTNTTR